MVYKHIKTTVYCFFPQWFCLMRRIRSLNSKKNHTCLVFLITLDCSQVVVYLCIPPSKAPAVTLDCIPPSKAPAVTLDCSHVVVYLCIPPSKAPAVTLDCSQVVVYLSKKLNPHCSVLVQVGSRNGFKLISQSNLKEIESL